MGIRCDLGIRYPGHHSGPWPGETCTVTNSVSTVIDALTVYEVEEQPYSLICRSLGAIIAVQVALCADLKSCEFMALWGPPSRRSIDALERNGSEFANRCAQNRVTANESYFRSWVDIESSLLHVNLPCNVGAGTSDSYCSWEDLENLSEISIDNAMVSIFEPINGLAHEVPTFAVESDALESYSSLLFDSIPMVPKILMDPIK